MKRKKYYKGIINIRNRKEELFKKLIKRNNKRNGNRDNTWYFVLFKKIKIN